MSAIIAGKCTSCGHKYYLSLGHPKWFDDWIKRKVESPQVKRFRKIIQSEECPSCLTGIKEFNELIVAVISRIEYGRKIKRRQ